MSASQPRGRLNGTFLVFCLALGLVGMSLLVKQHWIAGGFLILAVGGALVAAIREDDE